MRIASIFETAASDTARLARNLRWGIKWGLVMGGALCLFTIVSFILNVLQPSPEKQITLTQAFAVDISGPLVGGIIMGLFRPLLRSRLAAIIAGILAGAVFFAEVCFLVNGPVAQWGGPGWIAFAVCSTVIGGGFANEMWEFIVEPALPPPELPPGPAPKRRPLGLWKPR